jgi:hypothetical protein
LKKKKEKKEDQPQTELGQIRPSRPAASVHSHSGQQPNPRPIFFFSISFFF